MSRIQQNTEEETRTEKKRCAECGAALRFNGECPRCDAPDGVG